MSLCDGCFAPGQCCRRIRFYGGGELAFDLSEPIEDQIRSRMHADDADRLMPFRPVGEARNVRVVESTRTGSFTFTCVNLQPSGRCGDYENRPWLCRVFEPGSDALCVHYRGSEGGEGVDAFAPGTL